MIRLRNYFLRRGVSRVVEFCFNRSTKMSNVELVAYEGE